MKANLSVAGFGLLLSLNVSPGWAKPVWLQCGGNKFSLNEEKGEYSTVISGRRLVQGKAIFFPSQINFEVPQIDLGQGSGVRDDYSINRQTLEYKVQVMRRFFANTEFDKGWIPSSTDPRFGTCKILKDQTSGNKI